MPALRLTPQAKAVWFGLIGLALLCGPALGLTPKSPEVQRAVARAQKWLVTAKAPRHGNAEGVSREYGEEALIGLALLKSEYCVKAGLTKDHPRIKAAIEKVREGINSGKVGRGYTAVYATGLSLIFLAELKDTSYRGEIAKALNILLKHQLKGGGFAGSQNGRPSAPDGDTSMTQYAVLGMWEAKNAGVRVPSGAVQKVANWLIRTQLREGPFTYRPNSGFVKATHSMAVAGAGSLYICGDFAKHQKGTSPQPKKKQEDSQVPSALKPTSAKKKKEEAPADVPVNLNMAAVQGAMSRADAWIEKNFIAKPEEWPLYFLYGAERYFAFREKWENEFPEEPDWYTLGARSLVLSQGQDGTWSGYTGGPSGTAFAVLFLIRGTKITVREEAKAGGTLLSGSGLPTDLENILVKDGQVTVKPLAGPATELLEILNDPDDPRFQQAVAGFGELVIKADDIMLSPHLVRLKKLAKSGTPAARASAVTALGKSRDLDYVPTLIYALRDEHPSVVKAARDGLRFVSRKFDGFGLKPDAEPEEKAKAIARWKDWYRTVRPDAEFDD